MGKFEKKKKKFLSPQWAIGLSVLGILAIVLALTAIGLEIWEEPPEEQLPAPVAVTEPTLEQNPYEPADFSKNGPYMTLAGKTAPLGVDVSEHQGEINWEMVRDAGMEFAFIRLGYRGNTTGGLYVDSYAHQNLTEAAAAGLEVGVYFYSQAISREEALEEASFVLEILKDYDIDLPVVFDWEYVSEEARTGQMDPVTLTEITGLFCQKIEDAGYQPMVYFNPTHAENFLNLIELDQYPFWLALYSDELDYSNKVEYWQYSHTGSVPGIQGNTDLNIRIPET